MLQSGNIVLMDNLSHYKSDPALALITNAGERTRFLPAYSPDLNPTEKMWSEIESLLRTAEARSPAGLISAIGQALAKVTPRMPLVGLSPAAPAFIDTLQGCGKSETWSWSALPRFESRFPRV